MFNKSDINWSLYLITDRMIAGDRNIVDIVRAAIQGGVTVVQMREKTATTSEMIDLGRELHNITRNANVPLIVNDRVDIALAIQAEGVHVGPPDDMPASLARQLLGPNRILGVSTKSPEIALQAKRDGADYVGVVGIRGIHHGNVSAVIEAGADGVSLISAIVGAAAPEKAARELRQCIDQGRTGRTP